MVSTEDLERRRDEIMQIVDDISTRINGCSKKPKESMLSCGDLMSTRANLSIELANIKAELRKRTKEK